MQNTINNPNYNYDHFVPDNHSQPQSNYTPIYVTAEQLAKMGEKVIDADNQVRINESMALMNGNPMDSNYVLNNCLRDSSKERRLLYMIIGVALGVIGLGLLRWLNNTYNYLYYYSTKIVNIYKYYETNPSYNNYRNISNW